MCKHGIDMVMVHLYYKNKTLRYLRRKLIDLVNKGTLQGGKGNHLGQNLHLCKKVSKDSIAHSPYYVR